MRGGGGGGGTIFLLGVDMRRVVGFQDLGPRFLAHAPQSEHVPLLECRCMEVNRNICII